MCKFCSLCNLIHSNRSRYSIKILYACPVGSSRFKYNNLFAILNYESFLVFSICLRKWFFKKLGKLKFDCFFYFFCLLLNNWLYIFFVFCLWIIFFLWFLPAFFNFFLKFQNEVNCASAWLLLSLFCVAVFIAIQEFKLPMTIFLSLNFVSIFTFLC